MYNLLEYSDNFSMIPGGLQSYYRNEIDDVVTDALEGKSFKYTKKNNKKNKRQDIHNLEIKMSTDNSNNQYLLSLNTKLTIRLKYLDNFQRFLDLPLIDCKIELHLRWSNCVLSKDDDNITGVSFMNTSAKRFVPIVTFSINNNIQFLENIKQRFKKENFLE